MRSSFSARESRLIRASSRLASAALGIAITAASSIGVRERVYFAPLPARWAASRRGTSVVQPQ
jgi:predicted transcriptional regulator